MTVGSRLALAAGARRTSRLKAGVRPYLHPYLHPAHPWTRLRARGRCGARFGARVRSVSRGSQLRVLAQHARSFEHTVLNQLDRLEMLTQGTIEQNKILMKQVDAPGQMPQVVSPQSHGRFALRSKMKLWAVCWRTRTR